MAPRPSARLWAARGKNPEHSLLISSLLLLVIADVADDVGDVLAAFFLVGDDGGIVIIVVFNGLVDLDIVFRFGNDGLDLAGVLLGVGFPRAASTLQPRRAPALLRQRRLAASGARCRRQRGSGAAGSARSARLAGVG